MAPYIAALVILIVAILFSVYKGVDGFTVEFTDTSTFSEFMTRLDAALQRYLLLKQKVDSSAAFDDTLALPKLKELGFDRPPGERPFSKAISAQLETDILLITGMVNMFQKQLTAGTIQKTDLLKKARENVQVDSVAKVIPRIEEVITKREQYIASKAVKGTDASGSTVTAAATGTGAASTTGTGSSVTGTGSATGTGSTTGSTTGTATGSKTASTVSATDASGSSVSGSASMDDLFSALTGVQQALKASKLTYETETAPGSTERSSREMEERIAKSVAKQLKDSVLAKRATIPASVEADIACPYATYDSTATAQGRDYNVARPQPDMSEYIRKDSIPCWNCSLP